MLRTRAGDRTEGEPKSSVNTFDRPKNLVIGGKKCRENSICELLPSTTYDLRQAEKCVILNLFVLLNDALKE